MFDLVTICVEARNCDIAFPLEEFSELTYMNPHMISYLSFDNVDSNHSGIGSPLK